MKKIYILIGFLFLVGCRNVEAKVENICDYTGNYTYTLYGQQITEDVSMTCWFSSDDAHCKVNSDNDKRIDISNWGNAAVFNAKNYYNSHKECFRYIVYFDKIEVAAADSTNTATQMLDYRQNEGNGILSLVESDEPIVEKPKQENLKCDNIFSGQFGKILDQILNIIKFLVPVLIIGLAVVDFIKAMASQNQDELKKAGNKFIKRLIIGMVIFLLPTVIEFLLRIAGIEFGVCALG